MRKRSGVIAALEERMRGPRPIGPLYLSWSVWISLLLFFFLIPNRPALAQEAGQIVSVLGAVEIMREGRWQPIGVGETLAVGAVVRTREDGRIAVQLANGSQLKINANSHLELKQIAPREGLIPTTTHPLRNILRLLSGEVWVRGNGEPLQIQTIPVIATIRGTEFNLAVGPSDFARLAVLDGLVEFSNPQGSELVAANEQATAKLGEPPRKTVLLNPLDAVQWSLYYPDPAGERAEQERAARADPRSPRYWTWAARQHLLRGQVPEARRALDRALALDPNDARAYALRAAVALVQNRKAEAGADAERAVAVDPAAPEAYLALSWVQQAEFDLDGALASARRAVALDPDDPQALIQESRLLFGMGRTREATKVAEKARQRAPKDALVNSTWGFLQLARGRVKEADKAFQEAIAQDSTLGEPHLGLGLALFRRNKTEAAVEEMRKATLLEPMVSLYNSYLGKAYYEIKDDRLAQKYFEAAKQLDPRDPTPHFYDAIRLQSVNRPVEAVQELQKSIELNDDRGVYRSTLLLDEDLAARSARLGYLYRSLGLEQPALLEGWQSLDIDQTNYSAHRLLADAYSGLPLHEMARDSELLQAQLLQPININPVQPRLSSDGLAFLNDIGPYGLGFNEYTRLFATNGTRVHVDVFGGERGTLVDNLIFSGLYNNFSYSLGQFYTETNGYRENSDVSLGILNAFFQVALTPDLSVLTELRKTNLESGYRWYSFFDINDFYPSYRDDYDVWSGRVGFRYNPSQRTTLLGTYIHSNESETYGSRPDQTYFHEAVDQFEFRHILQSDSLSITSGLGYLVGEAELQKSDESLEFQNVSHLNGYLYNTNRFPSKLAVTLGLSADSYKDEAVNRKQVNPKFGFIWRPFESTTIRGAAFRSLKKKVISSQTIEPTQIAGFNQFFDGINGEDDRYYGLAIDQKVNSDSYIGAQVSIRDTIVPWDESIDVDLQQKTGRVYLYRMLSPRWVFGAQYQYEKSSSNEFNWPDTANNVVGFRDSTLQRVPLELRYFNPSGFFAWGRATYVNQKGEFAISQNDESVLTLGSDDFVLFDAAIGYWFTKRLCLFSLEVRNLLDQKFKLQEDDLSLSDLTARERVILARFSYDF